jgi:ubiquinone/menaquinone biosynthesis C-methylase UbiE
MLNVLDVRIGNSVLDVGCGAGDDAREIARLVGPTGRVVGVDHSEAMVQVAREKSRGSGLSVEFQVGDAQHLLFADSSFDRYRTERMLMHVSYPKGVITEAVRVLRSGGRAVAFDFDHDGLFVDSTQKETTRKIVSHFSDGLRSGWIGRQMPRLFREAGLVDVSVVPHTILMRHEFLHQLLDGFITKELDAGTLTRDEVGAWWRGLEETNSKGDFFAGITGFIVSGRRP